MRLPIEYRVVDRNGFQGAVNLPAETRTTGVDRLDVEAGSSGAGLFTAGA